MGYSSVRIVELHPGALFAPKGAVAKWGKNVSRQALRAIKDEAPVNVRGGGGTLERSLYVRRRFSQARLTGRIEVATDVDYAPYVLRGTGTIETDNENGLFLPFARIGSHPKSRSRWQGSSWRMVGVEGRPGPMSVRGQDANNFMARGWNRMAKRHRAIGTFSE